MGLFVKENELCYRSEQVLLGEYNSCEGLGVKVIQPFSLSLMIGQSMLYH